MEKVSTPRRVSYLNLRTFIPQRDVRCRRRRREAKLSGEEESTLHPGFDGGTRCMTQTPGCIGATGARTGRDAELGRGKSRQPATGATHRGQQQETQRSSLVASKADQAPAEEHVLSSISCCGEGCRKSFCALCCGYGA